MKKEKCSRCDFVYFISFVKQTAIKKRKMYKVNLKIATGKRETERMTNSQKNIQLDKIDKHSRSILKRMNKEQLIIIKI